jgi:hypothetical protein
VRKLIQIALVALGIRAFLRWRKRRQEEQESLPVPTEPDADPADELRRKLAESREEEPATAAAEPPAAEVADRRAEVHEQGRSALDQMKSSDES